MRPSFALPILTLASVAVVVPTYSQGTAPQHDAAMIERSPVHEERVQPYRPRFGRTRPVIAVIGENGGTELTDFVIPYALLSQSGVAQVVSVGINPGVLTMRPALRIQPAATAAQFDARFPDGADYVIVPAMVRRDNPAVLNWLRSQVSKGATLVSICDGALVAANAGLLRGHRATAHWATLNYRRSTYPDVRWIENSRFVADGKVVSSAGVSAALPTSLALVEAIAGHGRALAVGRSVGVTNWTSAHNSRVFEPKLGRNLTAFATTNYLNG